MGFVFKSWIRSFVKSPWAGPYSRAVKVEATKNTIVDLLQQDDCHVVLACNPEDPNQLYGFVCFERGEQPVLHYVYVKDFFRRMGVGSDLVAVARGGSPDQLLYTHKTPVSARFLPGASHRPGLVSRKR